VKQLVDAERARRRRHAEGVLRPARGDACRGRRAAREPSALVPEALPLAILHEDDALIAIDKPPGMATHPAPGSRTGTSCTRCSIIWRRFRASDRPIGPASYRLDKDTSGVLLVEDAGGAEALARQFQGRTIEKRHVALVHGSVRAARGKIDQPIGRDGRDRKRMSVRSGRGRHAVTALGRPRAVAGRDAARRRTGDGAHAPDPRPPASIGHPIVGDARTRWRSRSRSSCAASVLLSAA
jgi:23S rRNA pseudouridine1911/1915/1917 synthase